MKRALTPFLLLLVASAFAATKVGIGDLVKNDAKYDQKVVTATGVVGKFEARTSKIGKKYFVCELSQGKTIAHLFGHFELKNAPKNGQTIEVTGKFEKLHKLSNFSVKDQVEIKTDADLKIVRK
jgi:hypothetical protein